MNVIRKTLVRGFVGSVLTAGIALGMSGVSGADQGPTGASGATGVSAATGTFSGRQQQLEAAAASRQSQLAKLTAFVGGTNSLTTLDQGTLSGLLAKETTSVDAVVTHIPTDTTNAQLAADATQLYGANRVFAVMTPQVNLTNRADALLSRIAKLEAKASKLSTSDQSELTQAATAVAAVHTSVLAQTPQGYPGNQQVFAQARTTLSQVGQELQGIAQDVRQASKGSTRAGAGKTTV